MGISKFVLQNLGPMWVTGKDSVQDQVEECKMFLKKLYENAESHPELSSPQAKLDFVMKMSSHLLGSIAKRL